MKLISSVIFLALCILDNSAHDEIDLQKFLTHFKPNIQLAREYASRNHGMILSPSELVFLYSLTGDTESLENLLRKGANPNFYIEENYLLPSIYVTPLAVSIEREDIDTSTLLLDYKANLCDGKRPISHLPQEINASVHLPSLHLAFTYPSFLKVCVKKAERFLNKIDNVNIKDNNGNLPLHYALRTLDNISTEDTMILFRHILSSDNINAMDSTGRPPLLYAYYRLSDAKLRNEKKDIEKWEKLISLLIQNGANKEAKDINGYSANEIIFLTFPQKESHHVDSHIIAISKLITMCHDLNFSEDEAKMWIANLRDIDVKDHIGMTLLMRATIMNNMRMMKLLLSFGASPNISSDISLESLKEISSLCASKYWDWTPLEYLAARVNIHFSFDVKPTVEMLDLILDYGANPALNSYKSLVISDYPLVWRKLLKKAQNVPIDAIYSILAHNSTEIITKRELLSEYYNIFFLEGGRNVNERDSFGNNLIMNILKHLDRIDIEYIPVDIFEKSDLLTQNISGETPIMFAGNMRMIEELEKRGASLDAIDRKGNTIIEHLCYKADLYELENMLIYSLSKLKTHINTEKAISIIRHRIALKIIDRLVSGLGGYELYLSDFEKLSEILSSAK